MTTRRTPKPTAPPLADTLRAALAQGWHTLSALDALAPARGSSDARRAVHEALRAIKAAGAVLEERVGAAGVEVRLIPIVDPGPIPGVRYTLSPEQIEEMGGPAGVEAVFAETGEEPVDLDVLQARTEAYLEAAEPAPALDAAPVADEPSAPAEAAQGPDAPDTWPSYLDANGTIVIPCKPDRPQEPGPSSRCAVCNVRYVDHGSVDQWLGHPFTPKPRGRPPARPSKQPPIPNAAPAILPRARQRRTPGPVVDVDGGRVERLRLGLVTPETRAMLDAVCDEADERLAAVQAADPDVEELPSAGEQRAILDGAKRDYEAAVEEVREERAEPETTRGGSKETSDDATRDTDGDRPTGGAGLGPDPVGRQAVADEPGVPSESAHPAAPRPRKARTVGRPVESAAPAGVVVGRCRPPLCHADDIHVPSGVRGFARPLCERHRAWVEGAGGSVRYEPKEESV